MKDIRWGDLKFAVREHRATTKHWDFRFEFEGRLLSWASDDPPNLNPNRPIKLIRVEDHPLKYLLSEWIIPGDMRGAGPTAVGDRGFYRFWAPLHRSVQLSSGHIQIDLNGGLLHGKFSLKRLDPHGKAWIWTKDWDDEVDLVFQFPPVLTPEKILSLGGKKRIVTDFQPFFEGYS